MFLCFFTTAPSSKMCLNLLCTFTGSTRLSCVYDIDKLKDHYKNSHILHLLHGSQDRKLHSERCGLVTITRIDLADRPGDKYLAFCHVVSINP